MMRKASLTRLSHLFFLAVALALIAAGCASRDGDGSATTAAEEAVRPAASVVLTTSAPPTATPVPPSATAEPAPVEASGDLLVYPDSTALEPSAEGQEYFQGIWEGDMQGAPLRVPEGATGTFAYTRDTLEQVQAYYDSGLPAAGWEPVRNGYGANCWGYLWSKGDARLVTSYLAGFVEDQLPWFADTFDIHLPDTDVVLIVTYLAGAPETTAATEGGAGETGGNPVGDPLAYPGATLIEISDMAQEYSLDSLQMGCASPPIRTPDGTRGVFSYTTDTPEQIKAHYDAVLPAAGWTFVREWLAVDSIVDSWSNGTQRVDMAYMFDFSEAKLARLKDQLGMDIPPDHRLIVAWPWEAEE